MTFKEQLKKAGVDDFTISKVEKYKGLEILLQLLQQGVQHNKIDYDIFKDIFKQGITLQEAASDLFKKRVTTNIFTFTKDEAIAYVESVTTV